MSNSNNNTSPKELLCTLILLAVGCIVGVYMLWWCGVGVGFGGTTETWSHFGAFFGGVLGPILSFFSFLGIIYTVYLQSKSNKEQAIANKNTAYATESSEKLAKANLEEQKKQFKEQVDYDKQKRLLDTLLGSINEVETSGCDAVLDLINKDSDNYSTLGFYFNTYNWRAKVFCIELNHLHSKLDKESAEIIIPYLEKTSGQLSNYCTEGLGNPIIDFTNESKAIADSITELTGYETQITAIIQGLKSKFGIIM